MRWHDLKDSKCGDLYIFFIKDEGTIQVSWTQQIDWRMGCLMVRRVDNGKLLVPGFDGCLIGRVKL